MLTENKREYQDGNTTIIVTSCFEGVKSLDDIFESIIVDMFHKECAKAFLS
ncbi:MAG: hypothetical protein LBD23_01410 [Oscillospiraceae bacterium]|jgi:hypothetical protein|nr:hypothetical protein [Oscillospiraceae bacterium]